MRVCFVYGILLLLLVCSAQAENTISGSFELRISNGGNTDVSSGMFYYDQGKWLKIRVSSPIEQWMFYERDTLTIYYPGDNNGMKIPSISGEVSLPIFQLAINASLEDMGLTTIGYTLLGTAVSGDSIVTVWSPPPAAKSVLGNLTATYIRDSLMSITSTNHKGDTVLEQTYSNWVSSLGQLFPCRITSVNKSGKTAVTESIIFGDVVLSTALPEAVNSLSIPADADISTFEW